MTTTNVSQPSFLDLPPAVRRAQTAMQRPEVQAMLRRLSEFDLGIFMPHRHDEQTGDFQPLPDEVLQVESGCKVSFRNRDEIAHQTDRFLPVAWRWRDGALATASACEMVTEEGTGSTGTLIKHKMPNEH
ncbi:hypothetical protein D9M73_66820 [compost metagenome]|jgi:hypothetical protein